MKIQKTVVLAALVMSTSVAAAQQSVTQAQLQYERGDVSIQSTTETQAYLPPGPSGSGDYVIRSLDSSNSTINSRRFSFDLQVFSERNYELNETSKTIAIPRSNSTSRISVYRNGTLEDTASLQTEQERDSGSSETQTTGEPDEDDGTGTQLDNTSSASTDQQTDTSRSPIESLLSGILGLLPF
jgi:hypothetical protein